MQRKRNVHKESVVTVPTRGSTRGVRTLFASVVAAMAGILACSGADGIARPEGWEEESHGNDATANYGTVFAQDEVKRIDLVILPTDWAAMLADMTDMLGEFGTGGEPPSPPVDPVIAMAACEGLAEGDACHVELGGRDVGGICVRPPAAIASSCELHVRGLVPDEDLAAACDGLAEAEACSVVMPHGPALDGTCMAAESLLLCDVVLWTPGGDEPPPSALARDPIWSPARCCSRVGPGGMSACASRATRRSRRRGRPGATSCRSGSSSTSSRTSTRKSGTSGSSASRR